MSGWGAEINGMDDTTDGLSALAEGGEMQSYTVVAGEPYAVYVEFGTRHMPANGALRKSIESTMANLDKVVTVADGMDDIPRVVAEDIASGYRREVWVDTGALRDSIRVEPA